jgi:hypothetical protein
MRTGDDNLQHDSTLILSEGLFLSIRSTICQTPEGLETGVTLFGVRRETSRVALFAVGPGPRAVHTPSFHEPDAEFVNEEFARLRTTLPSLEWIGSLHVHPFGVPWLSGHDRRTLSNLFRDCADLVPDFIAGIIQRHGPCLLIYPYALSPEMAEARLATLEIVPDDRDVFCEARRLAQRPTASGAESTASRAESLTAVTGWRRAPAAIRRFARRVRSLAASSSQGGKEGM